MPQKNSHDASWEMTDKRYTGLDKAGGKHKKPSKKPSKKTRHTKSAMKHNETQIMPNRKCKKTHKKKCLHPPPPWTRGRSGGDHPMRAVNGHPADGKPWARLQLHLLHLLHAIRDSVGGGRLALHSGGGSW